jgi:hypothetical protein
MVLFSGNTIEAFIAFYLKQNSTFSVENQSSEGMKKELHLLGFCA